MSRHVVIGTAGHVDHGKTALVKALTGVDTDRFPEEQRRGITIDIGFAPLILSDDVRASVVDVPGHEDFIRNMVAGATGIDVALLVVAADEGVMPQTVEHLAILELLGVPVGVVAITKADLPDPDWLELVRSDVAERLKDSSIAWEAPIAVSALTGAGIEGLRRSLLAGAARAELRAADDLFRMPVDRVFSLAGAGTVVTGTTWSGSVRAGEQATILPENVVGRVRSIEVHGERREAAEPGRRTALALAGVERASAGRGSVAVSDESWRATSTLDVVLTLLPDAPRPLRQQTRVRLHLGTAEVIARVTPATDEIKPGETAPARLRLESPVVARWGDRGVIRSYSPIRTIGGGVVMDPWPSARPRRPAPDGGHASDDPVTRVRAFVAGAALEGLAVSDLRVRAGVHAAQVEEVVKETIETSDIIRLAGHLVPSALLETLRSRALELLARDHESRPLASGIPLEVLRQALRPVTIGEYVLRELEASGKIAIEAGTARLWTHGASLAEGHQLAGNRLLAVLAQAGSEGRTVSELDAEVKGGTAAALMDYYVRQGTATRVGRDRYYDTSALEKLARAALSEIERLGSATPAQLRDQLKLSRKYLIPLLEWLDLKGLTLRDGDGRRIAPAGEKYLRGA